MTPIGRLLLALGMALGLAWVPVADVLACSCAFAGFPRAIEQAEFAFIGTVVDADEPAGQTTGFEEAFYAFQVERAKGPMTSQFSVASIFGNGANCGLDMAVGERWLVLASTEDGRPRSHLCTGSTPTTGLDAETLAEIEDALTEVPPDNGTGSSGDTPVADDAEADTTNGPEPTHILLLAGAAAVLVVAGAFAFGRGRRS